jgi:1-pyrroline-5-carboxylate dehydrogenase
MSNAIFQTPFPDNEPVLDYAPGSPERESLKKRLDELAGQKFDIPLVIDGKDVRTGDTGEYVMPHDHGHVLASWHKGGAKEIEAAVESSQRAWQDWSRWPWEERTAVFLKAADLLAGPWRDTINAATMLGQSKTAHQAEIDAAAELIDFWRYNAYFAEKIYQEQPESSAGIWNRMDHRPLEGFVYAITPFNFTSIAGNLPTAPALMGGVSLWKPSRTSIYSNYFLMKMLQEAGLPDGVINFVRDPLHGLDGSLPDAVEADRREPARLQELPAHRRRDGRQGLRAGAQQRGPRGARRGAGPWRLRVPGPEVQRRLARLRPGVDLAGGQGTDGRDDLEHQDGRPARLP